MSELIPDPLDHSIWMIPGNPEVIIRNVHAERVCKNRPCVIHHPSKHAMRSWDLHWRDDKGVMERLCPHGVGHPDVDDLAYQEGMGRSDMGTHACDGCCATS